MRNMKYLCKQYQLIKQIVESTISYLKVGEYLFLIDHIYLIFFKIIY